jgi:predicted MFS family arabinose efflux permease
VFLGAQLGWDHWQVGGFLALWVIGYGIVQALAPAITGRRHASHAPDGRTALHWALPLVLVPAGMAMALVQGVSAAGVLMIGLAVFGVLFAVNSALHSYLILSYAREDGVSLDVGFYYMANAMGRLLGTVLSGWIYQTQGLAACLWVSAGLLALAALIARALPRHNKASV